MLERTRPGPNRRVVITGAGCIGPLGMGVPATWSAMCAGHSGIGKLDGVHPVPLKTSVAAPVREYEPNRYFDRTDQRVLDRVTQFTLIAAREAVAQSKLRFDNEDQVGRRTGIVLGTANGGETSRDLAFRALYTTSPPLIDPATIVRIMPNAPAARVSIEFGIQGPSMMISTACASSNHAIGVALQLLRSGMVDVVLAGGAESSLSPGFVKAWEAMRVLSRDTCRPFCKSRTGLVLGEGAAVFVLEALDHAELRNAAVLAELSGVGMSSDSVDMVRPEERGAAAAIQAAIADAGWTPSFVDYINAHGTGTQINDVMETRAIRTVFGPLADSLAISSTKSMHGHLMGAAGAIELIAVIGALRHGIIPPTINIADQDPACDLDVVPDKARLRPVRAALSNSFAFGGMNAVIAMSSWASPHATRPR